MDAAPDDNGSARHLHRRPRVAIRVVLGLLLLVNLAMSLFQLPLNRVVEQRLCRAYYRNADPSRIGRDGSVDEHDCKVDQVQQGLGQIQGVVETTWIVGDFIMTIPLTFLAEKLGRRAVLLFNLLSRGFLLSWAMIAGYFDHLPTKAIIAAPFLSFLGGDCVFNSITYALVSEMTGSHVMRAVYFGYMSSVSYVVALLGPALASASMSIMLWLPFWLGIALLVMAIPLIFMLPSSLQCSSQGDFSHAEDQREPLLSSPLLKAQDPHRSLLRSTLDRINKLYIITSSHPRNFSLLLLSFSLTSLASSDTKLLVQYISKRYHWTFASAGYLLSSKAIVNFTLLTVIVPRFLSSGRNSRVPVTGSVSVDIANIRYANICLFVSVLGALGIALASQIWILVPSLFFYALGSALPIFTLSLLKSPAVCPPYDRDLGDISNYENHIFSIVMLVKTVGSLVGAPTMAALWVRGIRIGGMALGMPYFVSSAVYAVAIGVFSSIKVD